MIATTIGYGQPIFDYSRRYANCASVNVILMVMEDEVPGNENCQRLKLAPAVQARLAEIKRLEHVLEKLSDAELKCKTDKLRDRLLVGKAAVNQS